MFLTTAEAAWIGVAIGGVFSRVNGWIVLSATRRKDHHLRIWDRSSDLYEQVLFEAASWAATRDELMRTYRLSGPEREIPTLDQEERQRTLIRLQMFGHRDVRDAFERCADAHWRWARHEQKLRDAQARNREIVELQIPEEPTSSAQIARLIDERNSVNQVADEQHEELRKAIQGAVRRVPNPDRWFRRLPSSRESWAIPATATRSKKSSSQEACLDRAPTGSSSARTGGPGSVINTLAS